MATPTTKSMSEMWDDGRRAYVVECMSRNEFPFKGWDKLYPDLAEERRRLVASGVDLHWSIMPESKTDSK